MTFNAITSAISAKCGWIVPHFDFSDYHLGITHSSQESCLKRGFYAFYKTLHLITAPIIAPYTYVHELGHAIALKILRDCDPEIHIFLNGGGTFKNVRGESAVGKLLGKRCSKIIYSAAGVISTNVSFAIIDAALSPLLGPASTTLLFFKALRAGIIVEDMAYGLRALFEDELPFARRHSDFIALKKEGVHPLIPLSLLSVFAIHTFALTLIFIKEYKQLNA